MTKALSTRRSRAQHHRTTARKVVSRRRSGLLLGTAALLAVLLAGCGAQGGGGSTVANLNSSSKTISQPSSSTSTPPTEGNAGTGSPVSEAIAYANCLRAHGLPNYPDPEVPADQEGAHLIHVPLPNTGSGQSMNAPQVLAADSACAKQRGAVFGPPAVADLQTLEKQALAVAACMLAHGIKEWPAPIFNTEGVETSAPPPNIASVPGFAKAKSACLTS
jgi:hypothetical protein